MKNKIKRILISNRGEIASRIIATCKEMGIETVTIFHETDKNLSYIHESDYSVPLIGETIGETYLNAAQIISISSQLCVDAIHPGYGFLSENADFADLVKKNGMIFIGPDSSSIRAMGNKIGSKKLLKPHSIPLILGYIGDNQEKENLLEEAQKIGLPLLIKAAAGGGGKGMKIVRSWDDFYELLDLAKIEAMKFFNDETIMLEKYLENPRHVEVQVLADHHNNILILGDRDCSLQRRHQKIIEEAPAPFIDEDIRKRLYDDAHRIAEIVTYKNAGTLEFVFDENGNYYFLEMNTRLQVEHPVTEIIYGIDLVKMQIQIAEGKVKPWGDVSPIQRGHAMEVRLYAEDPWNSFFPTNGKMEKFFPSIQKQVRYDFTYRQGDQVSTNFDPMLGKIIVHAENRISAIKKCEIALLQTCVIGIKTNQLYLIKCLRNENFKKGILSTNFIQKNENELLNLEVESKFWLDILPFLTEHFNDSDTNLENVSQAYYVWKIASIKKKELNRWNIKEIAENQLLIENIETSVKKIMFFYLDKKSVKLFHGGTYQEIFLDESANLNESKLKNKSVQNLENQNYAEILSPMPGKITKLLVQNNSLVKAGQTILNLEAMKLEHSMKSPIDGIVEQLELKLNEQVQQSQILFIVKKNETK